MSEAFDPYHRWLGISPKDQPPNHYRLLGLDHFEANLDVIEGAADQRMAHLKRFNTGKHSALAEKLLNEIAAARICLLNPAKKAIYDQALRPQQAPQAEPAGDNAFLDQFQTVVPPPPPRSPVRAAPRKTKGKTKSQTPWIAVAAVAVGLVAVVLIVVLTAPGKKGGDESLRADRTEAGPKKQNPPPAEQKSTSPPKKPESSPPPAEQRPSPPPDQQRPSPPAVIPDAVPPAPAQDSVPPAVSRESIPPPAQQPTPPADLRKAEQPVTPPPKEEKKDVVPPKDETGEKEERSATTPPRLPVPAEEASKKGLAMVHEIYKEELAKARTPAQKRTLAKKLFEEGRKSQGDAASRYALLQSAHELATAGGDATIAFETVDAISLLYDVEPLDMKVAAVAKMIKSTKVPQQRALMVEQSCDLLDEVAAKDNFDLARQLSQQLLAEARKARDSELVRSVNVAAKRIREQAVVYQQFQEALKTVKAQPDDAVANLTVGKYLCLTKGHWKRGLRYLAKGGDKDLQRAAQMESPTPPTAGEDQLKLADAWWDLGQARHSPQREQLLQHAGSWYEKADTSVGAGLLASKIDKRLGEIAKVRTAKPSGPPPRLATAPFDEMTAVLHQRRWSRYLSTPMVLTNSIGMKLILIPPGEYDMGTSDAEAARLVVEGRRAGMDEYALDYVAFEAPQHHVKVPKAFYLGVYLVTQADYEAVMGKNPSAYTGDASRPVETVTPSQATEFCHRLNQMPKEKAAGATYRLPTEAEWEYACRAGTTTRYYFGDSAADIAHYAWWSGNSQHSPHPVGQLRPNAWGLFDMVGNVGQICFGGDDYRPGPAVADPPPVDALPVAVRGEGWFAKTADCLRSAYRERIRTSWHESDVGFRVLRTIGP
jgi:formylglycine-generating enzyme required for sulfatase activity/cytoskeletal protein RodZ